MREVFGHRALHEHRLSLDLQELKLDQVVVFRQVTEAGESLAGLSFAVVVDEPSGREGLCLCQRMLEDHGRGQCYHENHADEENEGGEQLQAQWDQPCSIGLSLTGATDVVRAWFTQYQLRLPMEQRSSQAHRNRSRRRS